MAALDGADRQEGRETQVFDLSSGSNEAKDSDLGRSKQTKMRLKKKLEQQQLRHSLTHPPSFLLQSGRAVDVGGAVAAAQKQRHATISMNRGDRATDFNGVKRVWHLEVAVEVQRCSEIKASSSTKKLCGPHKSRQDPLMS